MYFLDYLMYTLLCYKCSSTVQTLNGKRRSRTDIRWNTQMLKKRFGEVFGHSFCCICRFRQSNFRSNHYSYLSSHFEIFWFRKKVFGNILAKKVSRHWHQKSVLKTEWIKSGLKVRYIQMQQEIQLFQKNYNALLNIDKNNFRWIFGNEVYICYSFELVYYHIVRMTFLFVLWLF